jgi:hypothetical protein
MQRLQGPAKPVKHNASFFRVRPETRQNASFLLGVEVTFRFGLQYSNNFYFYFYLYMCVLYLAEKCTVVTLLSAVQYQYIWCRCTTLDMEIITAGGGGKEYDMIYCRLQRAINSELLCTTKQHNPAKQ